MKSKGNGEPIECANNLLRIVRGEVPFDRVKGLGSGIIDKPITEANADLREDAAWLIETYEPRAQLVDINVTRTDPINGGFAVAGKFTEKEG